MTKKSVGVIAVVLIVVLAFSAVLISGYVGSEHIYTPEEVLDLISGISLTDVDAEAKLIEAQAAYDSLSDDDKNAVTTYPKLVELSYKYFASNITAQSVSEMIDGLSASFETESSIENAFVAYCLLSLDERAKVSNYDKLSKLRDEVADLYVVNERRASERMDRSKILIGTYCFYQTSEEKVKEMADCGIDFVAAAVADENVLDLFEKYGIGALVASWRILPCWRGNNRPVGEPSSTQPDFTLEAFREAVKNLNVHKAVWGIDIVDEPYAGDFHHYDDWSKIIYEEQPQLESYINLYPNYAESEQLGTHSYQEHIDEFVDKVDTDYICYDHYLYGSGIGSRLFPRATDNLRIVADACKESDRDFWIVIQANSTDNGDEIPLSIEKLKLQAFTSLAYGASVINWACWEKGWWTYNILDEEGNKTEQYEKVKSVNELLDLISPIYMRYKRVETEFQLGNIEYESDTAFASIMHKEGCNGITGFFEKNVGEGSAAMFTNTTAPLDGPTEENCDEVKFTLKEPSTEVVGYFNGEAVRLFPNEDGEYTLKISNTDCVFVTVN